MNAASEYVGLYNTVNESKDMFRSVQHCDMMDTFNMGSVPLLTSDDLARPAEWCHHGSESS